MRIPLASTHLKPFVLPQWTSRFLGHQEPPTQIGHHDPVGEQLRVRLQQRQPQPALQHVWL